MSSQAHIMNSTALYEFVPLLNVLFIGTLILWGVHWVLISRVKTREMEARFPGQLILIVLSLVFIIVVVTTLPVSENLRNKILGLVGILISGIIAFSSTNIVANLMSGVLLRITRPFRTGDFIRVENCFGRVAKRGLFDIEIQSESRDFVSIPNTFLVQHPVKVILNSGAIISTSLSLGYDVHHTKVESLLIQAARQAGLEDPFVHIIELGNFAVTYRISGLLKEVKWVISARSNLCRSVLDILHSQGIEIMSPTYLTQRRITPKDKVIPQYMPPITMESHAEAEDIVFDKAEEAAQREAEKSRLEHEIEDLHKRIKETEEESEQFVLKDRLASLNEQLNRLLDEIKDEDFVQ